ncbi:hypothetical protein EJ04DRAFT_607044 [Polyplosphaeria fusca]|uniref:Rhodopsin domain-containing protein n=1 Tax=Polyplosphaeria fusca TaxID=682080 RepID=A0A9P4QX98_9PLEO|nr:hypothetical protein EJ04DRAFT_607044 [Polyplosphaeria fusca]
MNLTRPVAPAPPGITANFDNPPNEAVLAYSTLITTLVCATIFTWFRLLVKLCIVRKFHLEDYIIPFAWIATIGHAVPQFLIYDFAPIIHSWDMRLETLSTLLVYHRVGNIFYNLSIMFIKIAMLIQVLRCFVPRGSQSKTYYAVHVMLWVTAMYYIAVIIAMLLSCTPIKKAWSPRIKGKCHGWGVITMTTAIFNLASDLAILALCQWVIWAVVQVDRKQRLKLSVVFCAGIIPSVFAALCLYYNNMTMHGIDIVHSSALMSLACYGEMASGIFVLFLPVLPRFLSWLKQKPLLPTYLSRDRARASSRLDFSDIGVVERDEDHNGRSLWHISYSQHNGEIGSEQKIWDGQDYRYVLPKTAHSGAKSISGDSSSCSAKTDGSDNV